MRGQGDILPTFSHMLMAQTFHFLAIPIITQFLTLILIYNYNVTQTIVTFDEILSFYRIALCGMLVAILTQNLFLPEEISPLGLAHR